MTPSSSARERSKTSKLDLERLLKVAADRWEDFPEPPPGGHWIPKDGPCPPPKFPDTLPPSIPADIPPLNPPLMPFTYEHPGSRSRQDPDWLNDMLAEIEREHAYIHGHGWERSTSINTIHQISALSVEELGEEGKEMQGFLHTLGKNAGSGFVEEMLQGTQAQVHKLLYRPQEGEENGDEPSSPSRSGGPSSRCS